jgi:hypothetical protein
LKKDFGQPEDSRVQIVAIEGELNESDSC